MYVFMLKYVCMFIIQLYMFNLCRPYPEAVCKPELLRYLRKYDASELSVSEESCNDYILNQTKLNKRLPIDNSKKHGDWRQVEQDVNTYYKLDLLLHEQANIIFERRFQEMRSLKAQGVYCDFSRSREMIMNSGDKSTLKEWLARDDGDSRKGSICGLKCAAGQK